METLFNNKFNKAILEMQSSKSKFKSIKINKAIQLEQLTEVIRECNK